jgi:hypothetical protein
LGIVAGDGAWCWFSDPRAVSYRGRTYAAWVSSRGDIVVGELDRRRDTLFTHVLHETLEADDHASPSLLVRPDGRIMAFYSTHADSCLRLSVAESPGDITTWSEELRLKLNTGRGRRSYCYVNPVYLEDKDRYYLFWRGSRWKPCYSTSRDGLSWEPGRIFISAPKSSQTVRPYVKVETNGRDRIHFAFTDGHPHAEKLNSIYYALYRDGRLWHADGSLITDIDSLPISPRDADVVYDARSDGPRAWIWDIAADRDDRPVIVYTRLPARSDHRYHYARWTGKGWTDYELCPAGHWFQGTPESKRRFEPYYSGGIALDHGDPSTVYLSRRVGGVFEIERWTTPDGGVSWVVEAITRGSSRHNVRPFVVRDARAGDSPQVLWMNVEDYAHFTDFRSTIRMDLPGAAIRDAADLTLR